MKSKIIKRCSDCGRFLSEDDFYCKNKKKNTRYSYCKKCSSIRGYLYEIYNEEYRKEYHEKWREDNKNHNKQWSKNNKEHLKEYKRKYYIENENRIIEYRKNYCKENKEYYKKWREDNRDICNRHIVKYRVSKTNQTPELTDLEQLKINLYYNICNDMGKDFEVDHIQPISKGGVHHPDNLQILLKNLNRKKSNKWPLTNEEQIKYKGISIPF